MRSLVLLFLALVVVPAAAGAQATPAPSPGVVASDTGAVAQPTPVPPAAAPAPAALPAVPIILTDVEYISGKDGFPDKMTRGRLVITPETVTFERGAQTFTIPTVSITEVSRQTDVRDGSVGKKMLFGALAGSRKQEFINLTSETATTAEGLMFKVRQGTSVSAVAKLRFYAKRARAAAGLAAPAGGDESGGSVVGQ